MKTIVVSSLSGGQGKTTTTLLLGRELLKRGYSVLLIDTDPQHSLTLFTGVSLDEDEVSLLELYHGLEEPNDALHPCEEHERLFIIPSDDRLDAAQNYLSKTGVGATLLERRLRPFRELFDYCIIDSPPQRSQLVISAIGAAELVLIPAEATVKGFASAERTLDFLGEQRSLGASEARLMGILPFRDRWFGRHRAEESRDALRAMEELVGSERVLTPLPESEHYKKAMNRGNILSERLQRPLVEIADLL